MMDPPTFNSLARKSFLGGQTVCQFAGGYALQSLREPEEKQQVPSPLRYPGFPVELGGVGGIHAAFLTESPTRGRW